MIIMYFEGHDVYDEILKASSGEIQEAEFKDKTLKLFSNVDDKEPILKFVADAVNYDRAAYNNFRIIMGIVMKPIADPSLVKCTHIDLIGENEYTFKCYVSCSNNEIPNTCRCLFL